MDETDVYAEARRAHANLNRTALVGRITFVAADPVANQITLGLEALNDSQNTFQAKAVIPCANEHLPKETLWYAKLWKKARPVVFAGAFTIENGVIAINAPDVLPVGSGSGGDR